MSRAARRKTQSQQRKTGRTKRPHGKRAVTPGLAALSPPKEALQALESLYAAGRLAEVEQRSGELSAEFPDAMILFNILGVAQAGQGKSDEAIETYRRALKIDPGFYDAHFNMGNVLKRLGRYDEAVASYEKAAEAKPDSEAVPFNMGVAHMGADNPDEAIAAFEQALELKPDYFDAHFNLGAVLRGTGRPDEAEASFRLAVENRPDMAEAHCNLAFALKDLGQYEEAVAAFDRALGIKPDLVEAQLNKGLALKALGRSGGAAGCFEAAARNDPGSAAAHNELGIALMEQGRAEEAIECYNRALELIPESPGLYNNLGTALHALGRSGESVESYRMAVRLKPDYAEGYRNLGTVLLDTGETEEAASHFKRALLIEPQDASAHTNLGAAMLRSGRTGDAVRSFRKAVEIDSGNASAHNNLGVALSKQGEHDEAALSCAEALKLDPDFPGALTNFSRALRSVRKLPDSDLFRALVVRCLASPEIDNNSIDNVAKAIAREGLKKYLDQENLAREDISGLDALTGGVLCAYVSGTVVSEYALETFLARVRATLLKARDEGAEGEAYSGSTMPLLAALAHQGFLNEYIWAVEEAEQEAGDRLEADIVQAIEAGKAPGESDLFLLAAYRPLGVVQAVRGWALEAYGDARGELKEVIRKQVVNPAKEAELREGIRVITPIDDETSRAVQSQYEENPYPRWESLGVEKPQPVTRRVLRDIAPHRPEIEETSESPRLLVAGCGTGKHPIVSALGYANSSVLAVDLSRASLTYAMRMAEQWNVRNLEFAHADILALGELDERFDVIESSGVLHHMAEPEAGLEVLLGLLKPGGYIKLGLYSETARRDIVSLRESIADRSIEMSTRGIRTFRHALASENPETHKRLSALRDFYSTSELRDFLFHVQEHRYTIARLEKLFEDHGLEFLGFVFENPRVKEMFSEMFPDDPDCLGLENWQAMEAEHPMTFIGMYQFWCRKRG